jgi:hypothetical protein
LAQEIKPLKRCNEKAVNLFATLSVLEDRKTKPFYVLHSPQGLYKLCTESHKEASGFNENIKVHFVLCNHVITLEKKEALVELNLGCRVASLPPCLKGIHPQYTKLNHC